MTSSISGTSNVKDGIAYWEKQVKDVNDVDEKFSNSRDLGYLRLNYSRLTAVGSLAKYDKEDNYKVTVQSNGKLSISIRNASAEDEKVLDLSKYEEALDELKKQTDPEGWAKEQEEKKQKEAEQNLIEVTAPGMQMQVYMVKNGREVLVGDSSAEKGDDLRDNLDAMLKGEYKATKGVYYVKVSRDDTVGKNEDIKYALQMNVGGKYKHDYVMTESVSDDTSNKKYTRVPATTDYSSGGTLSSVNALQDSGNPLSGNGANAAGRLSEYGGYLQPQQQILRKLRPQE